jgi:cytosine/adenosine deaminase-related metal-dependent hydrolase
MLKRGIRLAIGSADQPTSPLSEAHLSRMMIPAWTAEKPKAGVESLLRAVFSESARFAGSVFGFRMGSLEEGAAADVATFPAVVTRPLEDWDWAEQVLFGIGCQSRANNLIVDGNIVMENGVIETIVEEEILAKVREFKFPD